MVNRAMVNLNPARRVASEAVRSAALTVFLLTGVISTSIVWAQSPPPAAARVPKWEAASIKRCNNEPGGEQGGAPLNTSTNRIRLSCYPLRQLIQNAYGLFAGGHWNAAYNKGASIEQLPGWGNSEPYTVDAKAEGSPGQMVMLGPMLATLLESRFALKIRTESRDELAYALIEAKGGIKVAPFKGGCTPENPLSPDPTPTKYTCPRTEQDWPMNLDTFAWLLNGQPRTLDAPVINKTGISGFFRFNFKPFQTLNPPPFVVPADQVMESVTTALQDVGLKLVATKAPRQHLVVDHVERPSEN
jgi:uncharacterized protein (TIGR03435 family)